VKRLPGTGAGFDRGTACGRGTGKSSVAVPKWVHGQPVSFLYSAIDISDRLTCNGHRSWFSVAEPDAKHVRREAGFAPASPGIAYRDSSVSTTKPVYHAREMERRVAAMSAVLSYLFMRGDCVPASVGSPQAAAALGSDRDLEYTRQGSRYFTDAAPLFAKRTPAARPDFAPQAERMPS